MRCNMQISQAEKAWKIQTEKDNDKFHFTPKIAPSGKQALRRKQSISKWNLKFA